MSRRSPIALAVSLFTLLTPVAARAQRSSRQTDTVDARALAPGVAYRHVVDPRGPWELHVVRVDLRRAGLTVRAARALDSLRGRERTSDIVRRAAASGDVLAAVNADFFDLRTGENENQQVLAGEWWKGLPVTDSPYDTFDAVHAQLALDAAGRASIDRFTLDAHAWAHGVATPVLTVNLAPTGSYEGTALYTPRFGARTPAAAAPRATGPRDVDAPPPEGERPTAEAPLVAAGHRGDTLLYLRRGPIASTTGTAIPRDGAVLAAYGPRTAAVQAMAEGDTVRILLATRPRLPRGGAPSTLIGGWPRIVANGRSVADAAPTVEGTISRNAEVRHPRTAVGLARDGATLWLVTVDGRTPRSVGMTLVELASAMRRLGAWQALNFDGGGSTTMVVGGTVVNTPSDATGERTVGNALLVVRTRR